jgi:peptidoglycan hydrolase-like protein with peptidoglycan-binding domain
MRFEIVDSCPVPAELADEVRELKRLTGAALNSCDRSPEAEPMLRRLGKMSQRQLFEGFIAGLPGFNPANPPGRSTHERRNDGIAFPGPPGMRLRYWQVGMDWSNAPAVNDAARGRGWIATLTYPRNPREGHHVNFRREPRLARTRVLKLGSRGPDVLLLKRRLHGLLSPFDGKRYLTESPRRTQASFGKGVEAGLRRFQKEHHLKPDGVFGEHTHAQLLLALRRQKRLRREGLRKGQRSVGLVWQMQRRLARATDAQGKSYFPHRPTGRFGAKTEDCVKRFQRDQRLEPDGVFGPNTSAALLRLLRRGRGARR